MELQQVTDTNGDEKFPIAVRQAVANEMDGQIEAFMQYYSWAFPSGKPVERLSAYFAWRKRSRPKLSIAKRLIFGDFGCMLASTKRGESSDVP